MPWPSCSRIRRTRLNAALASAFPTTGFIVGSLVSKGVLFPENSDDLGRVVAHLKKSNNNTIGGVGGTLKSLRLLRNKADHTMDAVFATGISQFAYEKSRIALTQFESLPSAQMEAVVRTIQAIP